MLPWPHPGINGSLYGVQTLEQPKTCSPFLVSSTWHRPHGLTSMSCHSVKHTTCRRARYSGRIVDQRWTKSACSRICSPTAPATGSEAPWIKSAATSIRASDFCSYWVACSQYSAADAVPDSSYSDYLLCWYIRSNTWFVPASFSRPHQFGWVYLVLLARFFMYYIQADELS